MSVRRLQIQLKKRMDAIAKQRDLLDELIAEAEHLKGNCDEALENLDRARDALSELV